MLLGGQLNQRQLAADLGQGKDNIYIYICIYREILYVSLLIYRSLRAWGPCGTGVRLGGDREDASSMVTAGAKLTPRRGTVAHLGNRGCCVHIHTGNLSVAVYWPERRLRARCLSARSPVFCFFVHVSTPFSSVYVVFYLRARPGLGLCLSPLY